MTTAEIATKIAQYIREGKNVQAEEELYAEDIVSIEQNGYTVTGLQNAIAKTKASKENIEEFYGGGVSEVYVGPDCFLLRIEMDMKPKGGERMQAYEYGYYEVKDGKIVREVFFAEKLSAI